MSSLYLHFSHFPISYISCPTLGANVTDRSLVVKLFLPCMCVCVRGGGGGRPGIGDESIRHNIGQEMHDYQISITRTVRSSFELICKYVYAYT